MIDQDKPIFFLDAQCPKCGRICGNSGHGDKFRCGNCGWAGKLAIHPDDIKAIQEIMRHHKEQNREEAL